MAMIRSSDFRLFSVQAVVYTPDATEFRPSKALALVLSEFANRYDGDVQSAPGPKELTLSGTPIGKINFVPTVALVSEDDRWKYEANPNRADSFWFAKSNEDSREDLESICMECLQPLMHYADDKHIGRLALVVRRWTPNDDPANTLTGIFCQNMTVGEDSNQSPLRHSRQFALHNLKTYPSPVSGVTINSWVRCSTAIHDNAPAIRIEQDVNTLDEKMDSTAFQSEQIKEFFKKIPLEMNHILGLYFPI